MLLLRKESLEASEDGISISKLVSIASAGELKEATACRHPNWRGLERVERSLKRRCVAVSTPGHSSSIRTGRSQLNYSNASLVARCI